MTGPDKAKQAVVTQPWSRSREVKFKRRQWSTRAAMRKREAIQPRKLYRAKADTFLEVAGSNTAVDRRESRGFRRGQRAYKG